MRIDRKGWNREERVKIIDNNMRVREYAQGVCDQAEFTHLLPTKFPISSSG